MGALDGRIAIITGAGRGIGREHALLFASEGAKVVINDLGGAADGTGDDRTPAQQVADEIKALGGEAVANADNVADWEGAQRLVNSAVEAFGDLHVLVNNAGILRDRVLVNMTEAKPGLGDVVKAPEDPGKFDIWDPANISPLVAYLATEGCPANGKMFFVQGGQVKVMSGWAMGEGVERQERWTVAELEREMKSLLA